MTASAGAGYTGTVWRHIPRGGHALDFSALISAAGRWNRRGEYGCLYTATTAEGAAAEYRKHFVRRGLNRHRDLVRLRVRVDHVLDLVEIREAKSATDAAARLRTPTGRAVSYEMIRTICRDSLTGDDPEVLERCRTIADWARSVGYLALRAPSSAMIGATTLPIYPENQPLRLEIAHSASFALNYGPDPYLDADGTPRRSHP